MNIEYKNYQIRPYGNNLCWEIWKYKNVRNKKTGETRDDWVSLGWYPQSLDYALFLIYELELKLGDDTVDLKKAMSTAKSISTELRGAKQCKSK